MAREDAEFARHINDVMTLGDVLEAGPIIESLRAHPGWKLVDELVEAEIDMLDRELDRGSRPLDHAEYAKLHGRRGGLRGFKVAAETILARSEKRLKEQQAEHEATAEPVAGR